MKNGTELAQKVCAGCLSCTANPDTTPRMVRMSGPHHRYRYSGARHVARRCRSLPLLPTVSQSVTRPKQTPNHLAAGFIHKAVAPHTHTNTYKPRVHKYRTRIQKQVRVPDTGAFQSSPKNKFPGLDSAHTAKRINRKRKDARARHTTNNNSKQRHLRTHGPSGPERTLNVDVSVYVLMRHLLSYVIRGDARHTARWGGDSRIRGCVYINCQRQRHCRQDMCRASRWRAGFSLSPRFLPLA